MDDKHEAARFRTEMIERVGSDRFAVWFGGATRIQVARDVVAIEAASSFLIDWIRKEFRQDLESACMATFGQRIPLEFRLPNTTEARSNAESPAKQSSEPHANSPPESPSAESSAPALTSTPFASAGVRSIGRRRGDPPAASAAISPSGPPAARTIASPQTFGTYCVGTSNEFAVSAARLLAEGLHQASPVLFCGPTGVGKTHLLRAIRTGFREQHPRSRVLYLTAEQFTSEFVAAVRGSGMPSFRQKCRGAELLLLDDVHFLVGKRATLEELQHTIDAMAGEGRRLVLASDRPLGEMQPLGMEIVSRITGGLTCEIRPPELPTRVKILQQLVHEIELECDASVLQLVATHITGGARELRGALNRLHLTAVACRTAITVDMAGEVVRELAHQVARPVKLVEIQKAICDVFGIEANTLSGSRKGRAASEPRMLAMWLARKHTRAPWSEIGQFFGRRSHSTVISAHRRVEQLLKREGDVDLSDRPCRIEEVLRRVEAVLRTA